MLHIETSTKVCSVAFSEDGKTIAHKTYLGEGFAHSEKLTNFIAELFREAQVDFKHLGAISVAGGPGSYTGLRIGVSTAKGLCYALNIPLIAIDSLFSLACWAKENFPNHEGGFCSMIDARRMEVFSAIYDNDLKLIKPISADILDENSYENVVQNTVLLIGDGVEKTKAIWQNRKAFQYSELQADARGQVTEAHKRFLNKDFVDLAYYEPFYLKDFIAGKKKSS